MPEQLTTAQALKAAVRHGNGLLKKLLESLPPEVTTALVAHATLQDLPAGQALIERGERSEHVGYVIEGMLAMVQNIEDGRKHIFGLLVPTDIYGRLFNGPSDYRIEALTKVRILSFPRAAFEEVLRAHPVAERMFLVHLLDEVDAAREWLLLISGRKAVNRLASFLMILMRRSKFKRDDSADVVHVPMVRKDLAHYLGARPETLSRAFHALESAGVLRIIDPNHFEILDDAALIEAAGDDLVVVSPTPAGAGR